MALPNLQSLIAGVSYKPGWVFKIGGPGSRYVCVFATTPDSSNPTRNRTTQHMFEVPDLATIDFERWLFDCLLSCERHEAGEFFTIDGIRPFFPYHGDEGSPYDFVDRRETNGIERAEPVGNEPDRARTETDRSDVS